MGRRSGSRLREASRNVFEARSPVTVWALRVAAAATRQ
jgi:hypothetical protein